MANSGASQPKGTPTLQRSTSASINQQSILGFFQKKTADLPTRTAIQQPSPQANTRLAKRAPTIYKNAGQGPTPAPSSDIVDPADSPLSDNAGSSKRQRAVNYADMDDGAEEVPSRPITSRRKGSKRRRILDEHESDEYAEEGAVQSEDDMNDFVVPDHSDEDGPKPKKRKPRSKSFMPCSPLANARSEMPYDLDLPAKSTATQWTFDPENKGPLQPRSAAATNAGPKQLATNGKKHKEKAHTSEPEQRYPWLAKVTDADRNPPGHPDYDPRTVYIPPFAWAKFSPFEKQYWEIKQKFWDTIVFFKKGKFYELYENDATIGHQLFDLKLTDRVNMRMVGVPESSLDHWANQFVAKGFKIARVDQCESALGKEIRERDGKAKAKGGAAEKVIRRELAQVLTAGTLVDGSMLQDDMSTYCAAIKESVVGDLPTFGICFVDTATGEFFITEFTDDVDMTKFETFVAQVRPQELLLEKGCMSVKALRILKTNTGPTTIWNYLKPGKEFWTADTTRRDIDASGYFESHDDEKTGSWPKLLREARDSDLLMSAFGSLLQYLRTLKIERDLITQGNFTLYDPIRKATSLVLDGQTLINLEIFANSLDGGATGTLFALLNRCITPFGKRLFRQWVCHPVVDAVKINARLDAVESLNADTTVRDSFTTQLSKLPDLERLISRIHAGRCKAQDFVKVLEGFEQVDYTMSLLDAVGSGEGIIGQLISSMPNLGPILTQWKTEFDREKARKEGILVPERGVEEDFDASQDRIKQVLDNLKGLIKKYRRELGSDAIEYRDNGKEIYQLEVPNKVKGVPKSWDQISATQKVKRYYSPELRALVRQLQEAQETHAQIVKEVAGRFLARFDQDYKTWLAAVRTVAQLDCLISLAKASADMGEPSCRPELVNEERSVLQFEELRHPCMLPTVSDFIPNDVVLGGETENIALLTGANAAGKSTILRMTCVAVIMAQIGCYVPCSRARLTPVDRIMSRLGANDNIFAAQSTFFVELSETKKILSEATPRSLVILDELGRGTSSYDGVAVAQAVLHHVATHIGCVGFFATHYHSLATEFERHPEIAPKRMRIHVDDANRRVTFLYKLEPGVAEGSFGMHCAAMCGIPNRVIDRAEVAAREWEHTSRLKDSLEKARSGCYVPLGVQSDLAWLLRSESDEVEERGLRVLLRAIEEL